MLVVTVQKWLGDRNWECGAGGGGKRCSLRGFDGEQGRGATNEGLFSGRGDYCLHSYILFTYFVYI